MTKSQERFCNEYIIDFNATRAYKVAYPNCKKDETACSNASRMLRNDNVQNYIKQLIDKVKEKTDITQEMVLNGITEIAMNKEERTNDRLKAYDLLGKYFGMFTEKIQVEQDKPFEVNINVRK